MKRNILAYIVISILILSSVGLYFISREVPSDSVAVIEEYSDLWVTENSQETECDTEATTVIETVAYSEPASVTIYENETVQEEITATEEQFLYLNINTATAEELIKLDGIGEVLADRVIKYRNEKGGFNNIEEIIDVSGIGEKTFSIIRKHIYVEKPFYPTEAQEPDKTETEYVPETECVTEMGTEVIELIQETTVESFEENTTEELSVEPSTVPPGTKFDLNKVTVEELVMIPGVDRKLAESIVFLRTSIHCFNNVYELLYADGMSDEVFSEIADYLYVDK